METIAQEKRKSQAELEGLKNKNVQQYLERIDPEDFWEEIGRMIRQGIRITLEKTITREFEQFIGALEYERSPERKDVRNGHRSRDFGTIYGVIEDITIPRARRSSFTTWILPRFKRRSGRIGRLISQIFLRGLSIRDIKKISKHIYGENYSPSLVSRFNKELGEALFLWVNRPIEKRIKYLYLDGVNLSLKRDRASREALEEFGVWKRRYQNLAPKAVACLEKNLAETLRFFDFPYRMWVSLRTTNIIERVFREFRRRTKVMDTFPPEEYCIRIMFSLVQMINDDWKTKPMKNFR